MNVRLVAFGGLVCAVLALTGCDKGRQELSDVNVRVVNAAPSYAALDFQRETRENRTTLAFKGLQDFTWDADNYDFFVFDTPLLAGIAPNFWTFNNTLQAERAYTFVLTEVAGEITPVVLESSAAPAADAQILALHAAEGMPALDVYLERPGVGIAGATPRGTFGPQQQLAPRTLASGDYELFLTAAGNPANVLLTSNTITLPAGVTTTFIVVPEAGPTPRVSVVLVQPAPVTIFDRNAFGELRIINAATDTTPRDVALDSQFNPPLFAAVPFADPTAYVPVSASTHTVNVTPVGNPGVLELNQQVPTPALQQGTLLVTGPAGTLANAGAVDDGRRILNEAKLLFLNAATQFSSLEFLLVVPDGDPAAAFPAATLGTPGTTVNYLRIPPGSYDLYLRQTATTQMVSGPTRIVLDSRGIYGVLAINGADTATAVVTLFDDFP